MHGAVLPRPGYAACTQWNRAIGCLSSPATQYMWAKQFVQCTPHTRTAKPSRASHKSAAGRTAIGVIEQPEPDDFPPESLANFSSGKPRRASRRAQRSGLASLIAAAEMLAYGVNSFLKSLLQLLQLYIVVVLLIETPAELFCPGGQIPMPARYLSIVYMAFFGLGSVLRMLIHGELAPRTQDAQVQTFSGKLSLVAFVCLIVAGHWATMAWYGFCLKNGITDYLHPALQGAAATLLAGALSLHIWAARSLGKAYNRLVKPDKLIRTGPYAWCQHPIYTSYILLFTGYALYLGSWLTCLLFHTVCTQYYMERTKKEAVLLEQAFGNEYRAYREHTGHFVPRLV